MKRLIRGISAVIFFMIVSSAAFAAGGRVVSIDVKGNTATTAESISATIKTKVGSTYSRETIQQDIKELWKLGVFQDVKIEASDAPGGVALTYVVIEKPVITKISFKGNKKIKKDALEKEVTIHTYKTLSENALAESITKMRDAYAKKGYYLVDIDYHIVPIVGNEAELVFDISERFVAVVRKVEFIGNRAFSDKALRKVIRTREKSAFSFITGRDKYKPEQLEQDVMMLTFHYLNNGYLKVAIQPPKIAISKDKRLIYITFNVEEGKPYKVSGVDVSGDILTTREELKKILKVKQGTIYKQQTVEEDMMKLIDFYGESGYAFVNVIPDTEPNDETLTTPLTYRIEKGARIMIEKINITGNTTTRDKVIRRELKLKEGDIYNTRLVRESKEDLMKLGYFEEVNFATPRGSKDDTLNLNITVKEKATGSFNIGAGFSTAENFIFSASIAKDNFFGYGVSAQISAEISKLRQQFMLSFTDPYFLDSEWSLGGSVYRTLYWFEDFERRSYGGSLSIGHKIFDNSSVTVGYQAEQVEATDFSYVVPQFFRQNSSGFTSCFSLIVANDTRDNRLFPTKGMFHMVQNEVSGAKLGGDNDFYRVTGNSRFYYPIIWGIVAKANAKIGYIKSLSNQPVPLYERYYTGGVYSLRGFIPRSVGPRLQIPSTPAGRDAEFLYGGDKLLLFNAELEFPIYEPAGLRWVFFLDAGNAYAEDQNYSLKNLRSDWGLGLRWNSPMGPLRFEWGVPFAKRAGEDSVVFNFTIGSLF